MFKLYYGQRLLSCTSLHGLCGRAKLFKACTGDLPPPGEEFRRGKQPCPAHAKRDEKCSAPALSPDGHYSWFIAVLCFVLNLLYSSVYRCSGLFFTAIMSTYSTTRADASMPLSVYAAFSHLASLPAGPLIQSCGVRFTTLIGGLLITVGFLLSLFATGIPFLVVTFGVLAGSGHGFLFPCLIALISQNFDQRRGTALGITAAGAAAASLIFAKIYEICIAEYGVKITLGIAGALMLNIPVISLLFRRTEWTQSGTRRRRSWTSDSAGLSSDVKDISVILKASEKCTEDGAECEHDSFSFQNDALYQRQPLYDHLRESRTSLSCLAHMPQNLLCSKIEYHSAVRNLFQFTPAEQQELVLDIFKISDAAVKEVYLPSAKKRVIVSYPAKLACNAEKTPSITKISSVHDSLKLKSSLSWHHDGSDSSRSVRVNISGCHLQQKKHTSSEVSQSLCSASAMPQYTAPSGPESVHTFATTVAYKASILSSFREALSMPRFYVLVVVYIFYSFFMDTFLTVVVDSATDIGVSEANAAQIIVFFSLADTAGRLFIPMLTDNKLLGPFSLMTVAYLVTAIIAITVPFVENTVIFSVLVIGLGLPMGYIMIAQPQTISKEVGLKNLPIALGFAAGVTGVATFFTPLFIGFFRDRQGSYEGLLHLMGVIMLLSFLLCFSLWITTKILGFKLLKVFRR